MVNERYIVMAEKYLQYRVPNRSAVYSNVPISELDLFRKVMKVFGITYKMRYRGPRKNDSWRSFYTRQSSCLKQNATHFSVYPY